ncbi:uncharacterized protein LOC117780504 [Drosophila innubila]|uniref:uncharacterized protein LOC117780504 n=1 Tax=Drosophila innubila TaxID=198719 RepID=UPI00148C2C7D|nr:uncharacterized protein LOC117780504 [Drosophila innubila]
MHLKILFAISLLTAFALGNCIIHPKPAPRYNPDFTFPTDTAPSRQLPIWDWPILSNNVGSHRVRRKAPQPTNHIEQLNRCYEYEEHGAYSHSRLLLIWYSSEKDLNSLQYLRNILGNDLELPKLVYTLRRIKMEPNKVLFEMSKNLDAYKVLQNYCKLYEKILEYRSQGYDEPALTYEILHTDQDFYD